VRLLVVGSSDAFNSGGRANACYLIEDGRSRVMVDFGPTALASLKRLGRDPREIDGLVITHLHGDHFGGFPFLVIDGMFNLLRTRPLSVIGPIGLEARLDAILRIAYADVIAKHRPFPIEVREIEPGQSAELAGFRIEAFAASHMEPPDRPLCLRIGGSDARIGFSGDTEPCPGLFEAADGVDLLVAECTAMTPPAGRHCTWQSWQADLPKLNSKRVLLTHLGEAVRSAAPDLEGPEGIDLAFADDGMIVELP